MAEKEWKSLCNVCGGRCCEYVGLEIDKPTNKTDYDNIRWYLMHEGVIVFVDHNNKWTIQFNSRCRNLAKDYSCKIYAERPKVCWEYPGENNCEYEGEGSPYKILFENDKQFTDYLDKKKISWKWKNKK